MIERVASLAAVAALAVVFATSPLGARTIFPAFGASGDAAFDDHCPAHQFLIGLAGRGGRWIDQVGIVCSTIAADGTHGATYYGPRHGGGGGTELEFTCPADAVVEAARIFITTSDHWRIARVDLLCSSLRASHDSTLSFATNAADSGPVTEHDCPPGEAGSGFNGHYGKDVNALGLDCAVRTRE